MTIKKIIIIGAGPAGLLLAHNLIRRPGYDIHIIERRSDPREEKNLDSLRTYPIALQTRGIDALPDDVKSELSNLGIWTVGMCVHGGKRTRTVKKDFASLSVDRNQLTLSLLKSLSVVEKAEDSDLSINFEVSFRTIDLEKDSVVVFDEKKKKESILAFDHIIAADGARSKVRQQLVEMNKMKCDQKEIPDAYRTMYLLRSSADGSIQLDGDKVHGWMFPKEETRVIGAPIHDGVISSALVFKKGQDPLANLTASHEVLAYFDKLAPKTLAPLMTPELAQKLLNSPTSTLLSVRCDRLHVDHRVLLLGDAAHAVSASGGQGCNSTLEDVSIFCSILDQHSDDWMKSLPAFTTERLPDAHAVSELSDYSFPRTTWMRTEWIVRTILRQVLPSFIASWMRPMPMELLQGTNLAYREILKRTLWWVDRVKNTSE